MSSSLTAAQGPAPRTFAQRRLRSRRSLRTPTLSNRERGSGSGARGAARTPRWRRSSTWCCAGPATTGTKRPAAQGRVEFRRADGGYDVVATEGDDPLADQSPAHLAGLDAELADPHPTRDENSYPFAYEQIAQLFDHPAAPDLCVVHSAAHNWEDQGGHRGEHGSLGVVQARAPFVIAGSGVAREGLVPRNARLVDVAPTIARLLGVRAARRRVVSRGAGRRRARRRPRRRRGAPRHVVGFLFDGTNPNVLYRLAATGEAPNVARLIEMGTAYE